MAQTQQTETARLEQRALFHSLCGVLAIAVGSVVWGMVIESDVVILNGVFSFVRVMGSALYLTAARLVARPADADGSEDVVGVEVVLPIFTGGQTRSRVREQVQLHRAARERLEANLRAAERATRDAYLTSEADRERVAALRQAVASTQSAQRATQRGVEVGTRTTVDLLESQRRAFEAERDYARSRYDYLINSVRLRSTAGVLLPEDLQAINDHLQEPVPVMPTGAPRR